MANRTQRFGVGDPTGARSSEWFVFWKTNASDVYLGSRALGGWTIDPGSAYQFPFGVMVPCSDLRAGNWGIWKDKGTKVRLVFVA
jgi:hypothetical protein